MNNGILRHNCAYLRHMFRIALTCGDIAGECDAYMRSCTAESPLCTFTPQSARSYAPQCDRNAGVFTPQFLRNRSYGSSMTTLKCT